MGFEVTPPLPLCFPPPPPPPPSPPPPPLPPPSSPSSPSPSSFLYLLLPRKQGHAKRRRLWRSCSSTINGFFWLFYTTGKCVCVRVCVCVVWEKARWASSFSSVPTPQLSVSGRKCHFHGATCWASLETSLNLFNSFDVMWLFRVTASSPPPKKIKPTETKKRKLWVTLIEMLTCNYFSICHFWRCQKKTANCLWTRRNCRWN